MTPVQIAQQIKDLSEQLHNELADDDTDWDCDWAAVIAHLAEATGAIGDCAGEFARRAEHMDDYGLLAASEQAGGEMLRLHNVRRGLRAVAYESKKGHERLAFVVATATP